jgi:GNAT superfamily N-acetyltransferase
MATHPTFSGTGTAVPWGAPPALPCPAQELVIRRLKAADLPAIEAHLLALDPAGRASRFHVPLCDDAVRAYARRLDCERMILIGAFDPDSGCVIGLAEAHLDDADGPHFAEVSVSVLTRHRNRGIGRLLVAVALDAAAARGAQRAEFYYQAGNRAITHLVRDLGAPAATAPGFAALALPLGPAVLH